MKEKDDRHPEYYQRERLRKRHLKTLKRLRKRRQTQRSAVNRKPKIHE